MADWMRLVNSGVSSDDIQSVHSFCCNSFVRMIMSSIFQYFQHCHQFIYSRIFLMVQVCVQVHSHARSDAMHDKLARREVDLDEDAHTSKFRNVRID